MGGGRWLDSTNLLPFGWQSSWSNGHSGRCGYKAFRALETASVWGLTHSRHEGRRVVSEWSKLAVRWVTEIYVTFKLMSHRRAISIFLFQLRVTPSSPKKSKLSAMQIWFQVHGPWQSRKPAVAILMLTIHVCCRPQFLLIATLAAVAAAQHGKGYGHDDYDAKTPWVLGLRANSHQPCRVTGQIL